MSIVPDVREIIKESYRSKLRLQLLNSYINDTLPTKNQEIEKQKIMLKFVDEVSKSNDKQRRCLNWLNEKILENEK